MEVLMDQEKEVPDVPKRTSFGSGPHRNKELEKKKGLVRKGTKHKKPLEDQDA